MRRILYPAAVVLLATTLGCGASSQRMSAVEAALAKERETNAQMRAVLTNLDKNWQTYQTIQRDVDSELAQLREQVRASEASLTETRTLLDEETRRLGNAITTSNNDLRGRIDRTNADILNLREQSKSKLDDMSESLLNMGKGLRSILQLQRGQFQNLTDAYNRSLSDIEAYMPEAMLSTLNTPELLQSPNPDVRQPASAP